jgi:hypothetical protein
MGRSKLAALVAFVLGAAVLALPLPVANAEPAAPTIVLPSNDATVSGTQYLDVVASGATQVQYELSGGSLSDQVIATATPTWVGWAAAWNTTTVANGSYVLEGVASYSGGITETSSPVTLTVNNAPPSTSVTIPASGADVDTTQTDVYDAVASPGVTAVSFEVDEDLSPPAAVTLTATPTIYGWIAVVAGNPCPSSAPKPCSYETVPGSVVSVASYANGVSAPSPQVNVTFFINKGVLG